MSFPFSSCKVNSGALSLTLTLMSASFPEKFGLKTPSASSALAGPGWERLSKPLMSRKFLYRRSGSAVIFVIAILALFGLMAPPSAAAQDKPQLKRPHETPEEKLPEEKKPKKKIKGPRAVGLLQLTASGKGTLIPIAILVDGKFYDASAYKADPVPMALDSGTVYEAEQAGDSLGLFTVSGALACKNPGIPHPWVGAGSFLPQGADAPSSRRKAEDVPVGMDS